jgi:hypothetical protein
MTKAPERETVLLRVTPQRLALMHAVATDPATPKGEASYRILFLAGLSSAQIDDIQLHGDPVRIEVIDNGSAVP